VNKRNSQIINHQTRLRDIKSITKRIKGHYPTKKSNDIERNLSQSAQTKPGIKQEHPLKEIHATHVTGLRRNIAPSGRTRINTKLLAPENDYPNGAETTALSYLRRTFSLLANAKISKAKLSTCCTVNTCPLIFIRHSPK
jgi:hypothetical protein